LTPPGKPTGDAALVSRRGRVRAKTMCKGGFDSAIVLVAVGLSAVLSSAVLTTKPRFVWNTTASAPVGLYFVSPVRLIRPGDMVIAHVPRRFRKLVDHRRYIPSHLPLIKHVSAAAQDQVCAQGQTIWINGRAAARRHSRDSTGRPLPTWTGCVRLRAGDLFLLSDHPASFDGRYFGITQEHDVIGKAELIWAR